MNVPITYDEWWRFFTDYCRERFQEYRKDEKSIPASMLLAYEDTIALRKIPGLEIKSNRVDFDVLSEWGWKYDGVVDALFNNPIEDIRICEQCGFPMLEGYYLAGEYACCEECCLQSYGGDRKQMDEDLKHAASPNGECYWTQWDSVIY